jgi:hypothetical protein
LKEKKLRKRERVIIQCGDAASSFVVKGTIAFDEWVKGVVIDGAAAINGSSTT